MKKASDMTNKELMENSKAEKLQDPIKVGLTDPEPDEEIEPEVQAWLDQKLPEPEPEPELPLVRITLTGPGIAARYKYLMQVFAPNRPADRCVEDGDVYSLSMTQEQFEDALFACAEDNRHTVDPDPAKLAQNGILSAEEFMKAPKETGKLLGGNALREKILSQVAEGIARKQDEAILRRLAAECEVPTTPEEIEMLKQQGLSPETHGVMAIDNILEDELDKLVPYPDEIEINTTADVAQTPEEKTENEVHEEFPQRAFDVGAKGPGSTGLGHPNAGAHAKMVDVTEKERQAFDDLMRNAKWRLR